MRVLLVDDNPEFLKAAERILSLVPHLEVVGRASSGEEAVEQIKALRPGLVLINWSLPGMNGLEATRRISAQPNPPKVLILSLQDYPEYRLAAKEAGAEGLLSKSEFGQKIPSLIDYLIAQEDLSGESQPARTAEKSSEPPRRKMGSPLYEPSESASETAHRPPADHRMPELIVKLRENLTALETHCFYLQHWLEGGGKDSVPGQRDPASNARKSLGPFREAVTYYLLFEIRKELYALPADQVFSVENPAPLIHLPREYEPLVGLADINQRRVPIIDLRLWEKVEEAPLVDAGRLILVESKGVSAGLLVDAVRDLTTSAAPEGYPLPSDPAVSRKPIRDRLIRVKDRFLYVWDVDEIIAFLK